MNGNLEADSVVPALDGEPSLRRIRAALEEHRRRLDEGERAYRRWQAQWWTRERVIELQIRRVQFQLEGLPRLVQPPRTAVRLRAGKPRATVTACTRQATGRPVT
jgi:hypothetical protein